MTDGKVVMTKYAVVVDGICDVTTVVVVDAENLDDADIQAKLAAKNVPTCDWNHGEIAITETGDLMRLEAGSLTSVQQAAS